MKKMFNKKGFTLIESLVAVLIIVGALVGAYTLINSNLNAARRIKNNMIAAHLVQEGVEIVRNIRDSDWHAEDSFGASLSNGTWYVQYDSESLTIGEGPALKVDASNRYNYTAGSDTIFSRSVTISDGDEGASISKIVVVEVTWSERGEDKLVKAEEHLYDWR